MMASGGYDYRDTAIADIGGAFGVTTVAYDTFEEILWSGNAAGHVSSHIGPNLGRYTSFQVHMEDEIRQVLPIENVILCLTRSCLRGQLRRGLPAFTFTSDSVTDLQAVLSTGPAAVLIGGHQEKILEIDLHNLRIIRMVDDAASGCGILRRQSRYICCGGFDGRISLRDPLTMREEHSLTAHSGTLSDFDVQGNSLISCGYSLRPGGMVSDRFLTTYDLRMNRVMSPIPLSVEPFLLRFMPAFSSRIALMSTCGQLMVFDTLAGPASATMMEHVTPEGTIGLSLDVSSSCQCIAVGDSAGYIHRFSATSDSAINSYSRSTEFADPIAPIEPMSVDDLSAALSSIPMPVTTAKRLSDWPADLVTPQYRPTPPIDKQILDSMRMVGTIGYAPKPANRRVNQVSYPVFHGVSKGVPNTPKKEPHLENVMIPKKFRKLEPRAKNLEDYDFSFYNSTKFPGLENSLMNSYCNSGLQILYFHPSLRYFALSHLCKKENCLTCELAFLFHMLDQTPPGNAPVYPTNFLRTFRCTAEAISLSLVLPDFSEVIQAQVDVARLFQIWIFFIFQQILTLESQTAPKELNPVSSQFSFSQVIRTTCLICGSENEKTNVNQVLNLNYQDLDKDNIESLKFVPLVTRSFCAQMSLSQAWCESCQQYAKAEQKKKVENLPEVLTVNCGIDDDQILVLLRPLLESDEPMEEVKQQKTHKVCWAGTNCSNVNCKYLHHDEHETQKYWIPSRFSLKMNPDGVVERCEATDEHATNYTLHSVVYRIVDTRAAPKHHLVSCVRVSPFYHDLHDNQGERGDWYLFNDYSVQRIGYDDAMVCDPHWKIPCIVSYVSDSCPQPTTTPESPITRDVFSDDWELKVLKNPREGPFKLLQEDEKFEKGSLVAVDAEFVTLQSEEAELKSEGKSAVVKPSHKGVARITVVRGEGDDEGIPFMDDYISTIDHVADYLTAYSGIQPGDLDAKRSARCLATLKSAYVRLRYLVDKGVVFVGHGLKNDFFVINLLVPPEQILDTVHIFHLPHQRMISLRFLAWYYLGTNIQTGAHDSVEDARTALKLYRAYKKLHGEGEKKWQEYLQRLYEAGSKRNWIMDTVVKS